MRLPVYSIAKIKALYKSGSKSIFFREVPSLGPVDLVTKGIIIKYTRRTAEVKDFSTMLTSFVVIYSLCPGNMLLKHLCGDQEIIKFFHLGIKKSKTSILVTR